MGEAGYVKFSTQIDCDKYWGAVFKWS